MHYRGWASQCNEKDKALACRFPLRLKNEASCLCISIMVILAKSKGGANTWTLASTGLAVITELSNQLPEGHFVLCLIKVPSLLSAILHRDVLILYLLQEILVQLLQSTQEHFWQKGYAFDGSVVHLHA